MFSICNKISIVKLNYENFLLLKFQVITTFDGYDLYYIEPESEPPLKFLNITTETSPMTVDVASSSQNSTNFESRI